MMNAGLEPGLDSLPDSPAIRRSDIVGIGFPLTILHHPSILCEVDGFADLPADREDIVFDEDFRPLWL
jgi:hypothetical protein